jgi:NADH-quinone oxidoreductase subunit G
MHKVEINTDELVLEGRKEDRKKISMKDSPYDAEELKAIKKVEEEK